MRRYIYLLFTILLLTFCPKVGASVCSNSEKVSYQNLAKNISTSYEYVEGTGTFNIIFTNVSSNLYIRNIKTEVDYPYTNSEMVLSNFKSGNSYKFGIYTSDFNCRNEILYTFYITLPYYNPYYQDTLCSGIENYKYCKKFLTNSITYNEFVKNVNSYRDSLNETTTDIEEVSSSNSYLDYFIDFYLDYYYIILPLIIIICFIIRWRYNKKNDLF
jgi:hypothetical protein